jgi:hypothetical protein
MGKRRPVSFGFYAGIIMITATCKNLACGQFDTEYNFLGEPTEIQCGLCSNFCELSNFRLDPLEGTDETPSAD